jgi:predicted ATP-dependent serine protease
MEEVEKLKQNSKLLEFICTACGMKDGGKNPGRDIEWTIGKCKECRQMKYLTERKNFNAQDTTLD